MKETFLDRRSNLATTNVACCCFARAMAARSWGRRYRCPSGPPRTPPAPHRESLSSSPGRVGCPALERPDPNHSSGSRLRWPVCRWRISAPEGMFWNARLICVWKPPEHSVKPMVTVLNGCFWTGPTNGGSPVLAHTVLYPPVLALSRRWIQSSRQPSALAQLVSCLFCSVVEVMVLYVFQTCVSICGNHCYWCSRL